ncbi:MAG: phosphoadenosine phosphosulfate reductase [Shimia sp.]
MADGQMPLEDLSETSRDDWADRLAALVRMRGTWEAVGDNHVAIRAGAGDALLVTFEDVGQVRNDRDDAIPLGLSMAEEGGMACLTILCDAPDWFRSPALWEHFDRLTDEGAFDDYARVVFYGEGMGGYAAAAYSVAAPGAEVILVAPHATLDPRVTEWDLRHLGQRRRDWTTRYGYGPEMIEAARAVTILYDPDAEFDAMHTALYTRDNVTKLRCRLLGRELGYALEDMGMLRPAIRSATEGRLDLVGLAALYRERRRYAPYLRNLLAVLEEDDRPRLAYWMTNAVLRYKQMPRLRKAHDRLAETFGPGAGG